MRPEIAGRDEANTVVVEKRQALHCSTSVGFQPDGVLPYRQVLQDVEPDVLSSMIDLSAYVPLPLISNWGTCCSSLPIAEDCIAH